MRFISSAAHGASDYPMGVLLLTLPRLLGFKSGRPEAQTMCLAGTAVLAQSLVTRYEAGVVPLISMKAHLWNDVASGLALAASPWLLGFQHRAWVPHVVLGPGQAAAACLTDPHPRDTVSRGMSAAAQTTDSHAWEETPRGSESSQAAARHLGTSMSRASDPDSSPLARLLDQ